MDDNRTVTAEPGRRRIGAALYAALKSRLGWKTKVAGLRKEIKHQRVELYDVRRSRDKWKNDACELRSRVLELEEEAARLRQQLGAPKKTTNLCVG